MNCPLFEAGTPPPHNSDMTYGLETGTTTTYSVQLYLTFSLSLQLVRSYLDVQVPVTSNKLREFGILL